ncbi:unnamed protein product [Fraxinus pennsylvanica]|uniref:Uncharacterized protein n=1 Tax=Fraxinus pennsylvanica TaxID=56036 RepID=A0AAD1Z5D5_9LAMI|nr:unnamed protein product [Fraxinus pennsylvanica]
MGFWSLLEVASMPNLQILLICLLGAFMATDYLKLLSPDARRSMNRGSVIRDPPTWRRSLPLWWWPHQTITTFKCHARARGECQAVPYYYQTVIDEGSRDHALP